MKSSMNHLCFSQDEHEERQQRVVPILVHEPEQHADHLEDKERRHSMLLKELAESWHGNVVGVLSVLPGSYRDLRAVESRSRHVPSNRSGQLEFEPLETTLLVPHKLLLRVLDGHFASIPTNRHHKPSTEAVAGLRQGHHLHVRSLAALRNTLKTSEAANLGRPLGAKEQGDVHRQRQQEPQHQVFKLQGNSDSKSNRHAIDTTERQPVESPIFGP
mmetsp:Transcript_4309/g.12234  ORF Transcript_4309/g.12234 Transcript_4309/m.12234 type:complete len:216 (-) Transcript_4309:129-776(-)